MSRFLDEEKKVVSTHADKINFQNQSRKQDVQVSYGAHRTLKPFPNMNSGDFVTCNTLQEIVHHRHTTGSG